SAVLLLHMMVLNWHQGAPAYFIVAMTVMALLTSAAISVVWINATLLLWTTGMLAVVIFSPAKQAHWFGHVMMMYPLAMLIFVLGTALLKARQQLEQQQHWLEKAQTVSKMAGWQFDLADRTFTWSPTAKNLLKVADLETTHPRSLVSNSEWRRIFKAVTRTEKTGDDFEVVVQGKDGQQRDRWWSVKGGILREEGVDRVVGVFTDVTDAVAKERELTRAKESAESAVIARTRFLANMSHEIRTPMNGVIGMASLLLDGELGSKERSYAEIIRNSGESLLTIINQILDFSKYEAGSVTLDSSQCDLEQLVTEALDIVDHSASQKGLKLYLDMPLNTSVSFRGDGARLRQVMVNLLSNAVKFTQHGSVTMKVDIVNTGETGSELNIEVIDTGIGITPAALPNLFDPFVQGDATTTRKFGGTGLGLAISREIVQAMGGEIDVYSHPRTGSKFRFHVPLLSIKQDAVAHVLESRTVCLVTQDSRLEEIARDRCRDLGFSLTWVQNTADLPTDADLVMLDTDYIKRTLVEDFAANPDVKTILLGPLSQRSTYKNLNAYWLRLPLLNHQLLVALGLKEAAASTATDNHELEQFNHLRVLLAEDNAINQKVAQQMLKKLGCVADVAQNGRETLHMMSEKEYDLVFMDVQMPEVDGLEATRLIRVNSDISQPYIVAMTANVMQEDREICRTAGMDDFVAKPVRLDEVSKALRRASNQINSI
ncbi:MAG: ATP-binding protein, partial [Pseudomonadales bacterium]